MLHFGTHKPYDDDDDDDIYGIESEDDCDQETNIGINNKTTDLMKNWENPNWFITLWTDDNQKHYINIANISSIHCDKEQNKRIWDKKLRSYVPVNQQDYSSEEIRQLEYLGEITTATSHYLYIITVAKTYKCQISHQQVDYYSNLLMHNNLEELYLKPIKCQTFEIV